MKHIWKAIKWFLYSLYLLVASVVTTVITVAAILIITVILGVIAVPLSIPYAFSPRFRQWLSGAEATIKVKLEDLK